MFAGADALVIDTIKTEIRSTTPETTSAKLSLFRADTVPADADILGELQFRGQNSAAENIEYGKITTVIGDKTNGAEQGIMRFWHKAGTGLDVNVLTLTEGRMTLVRHVSDITSAFAEMRIIKEDDNPGNNEVIGELDFGIGNTNGTFNTYATIRALTSNEDPGDDDSGQLNLRVKTGNILEDALVIRGRPENNSSEFMFLTAINGNARMQPGSGIMAYFVTQQLEDFSQILGTSGSLQIPRFTQTGPTKNQLDSAFGNFDGAIGYETADNILYVRENSSQWRGVSLPLTVP